MTIIDTDHNGTIDFHELAKGLQKLDLRVEVSARLASRCISDGSPDVSRMDLPIDLAWISRWISRRITPMACPLIEFRCTSICSW